MLRMLRSDLIDEMVAEAKKLIEPTESAQHASDEDDDFLMEAVLEHEQFHAEKEYRAQKTAAKSGPLATSTPLASSALVPVRKILSLSSSTPPSPQLQAVEKRSPKSEGSGGALKKKVAPQKRPLQEVGNTPTTFPVPSVPGSVVPRSRFNTSRSSSSSSSSSSSAATLSRVVPVGPRSASGAKRLKASGETRGAPKLSSVNVSRVGNPLLRHSIATGALMLEEGPGEECSDFDE